MGEVVGSGERHSDADPGTETDVRVRYGDQAVLMWVLKHDDIQDLPLVYRVNEPVGWLAAVMLP
jgi:hypothetical protein